MSHTDNCIRDVLVFRTYVTDHSEPISLLREWSEVPSPETVDRLGDQEAWDYERYGTTKTYVVVPHVGLLPFHLEPFPGAAATAASGDVAPTVPSPAGPSPSAEDC